MLPAAGFHTWRRLAGCGVLLAALWVASGQTQAADSAIRLTADVPWIVQPNPPEPLQRALQDVQRDWYKVFGHRPGVFFTPPGAACVLSIHFGVQGEWSKDLLPETMTTPETFQLRLVTNKQGNKELLAVGSDVRGAIYAAYALSEELLGVDPWCYWTDHEPAARNEIDVPDAFERRFGPPTVKYRGWFINDEDLLSAFSPDPLHECAISPAMYDKIYETLLRLRGNMVIPATFAFPDERCQELAHRRGLALSHHHIQVVGLNTYRWPKDQPYSYSQSPELLERNWQKTVDAWKDYEVVWVIGYRGRHDRPFWHDEKGVDAPEARGALIGRAMAVQVEMIRKVQPNAMIVANLWSEGANLYHRGLLPIPPGVVLVWPDAGNGCLGDGGKVQAGQGAYYHTAMLSGQHNQLSEMVSPRVIYGEVGRYIKAGATEHFLVNVSDIRPVPLSTDCAMRLVFDAQPYLGRSDQENADAFLLDWSRRQFGPDAAQRVAAVYAAYFETPYIKASSPYGDNALHTRLQQLYYKAAKPIENGEALTPEILEQARAGRAFVKDSLPYLQGLAAQARPLLDMVPADRRDFYLSHVLTQIDIHLYSNEALDAFCQAVLAFGEGHKDQSLQHVQEALKAIDALMASLRQAEYGKWSNWYQGEGFVGIEHSRGLLRTMAATLQGKPRPPMRRGRGYEQIYEYQTPFSENFPLLYPPH